MSTTSAGRDMTSAVARPFLLDRRQAVPALIGRHQDFLIITGLAGTSRDIAALTNDGAHTYTMAGAMGGMVFAQIVSRVLQATNNNYFIPFAIAATTYSIALALILMLYHQSGKLDIAVWQTIREANQPKFVDQALPEESLEIAHWPTLPPAGVEPKQPVEEIIHRSHV